VVWRDHPRHEPPGIPQPDDIVDRTVRRLVLQAWADSGINWFVLLWNQREAMEKFYGKINYRPALFSKGRPFDADHIVARDYFLWKRPGISDDEAVYRGIVSILHGQHDFRPIAEMRSDMEREGIDIKWLAERFRKNFSNSVANYRYWPRRLNRSNQNKVVAVKMDVEQLKRDIEESPLEPGFGAVDEDLLWKWSAIPRKDESLWKQLPPEKWDGWDEKHIGEFMLVALKREHFLYTNAYKFLENK